MFNDKELDIYFKKHALAIAVREYINMVRNSESSRLVGRQAGNNVCTEFSSKKMNRSIQTESRTAELPFAIEFEYDDSIYEFWDQPQPITISRTYKNGAVRPGSYTPDFLLLTHTGPLVVEIKTAENLAKLVEKNPQDWVCENGAITFRPAKEAFTKLGLAYKVCSTAQISLIRTENLKLLLNSRRAEKKWDESFYQLARKELSNHSWMRISELAKLLKITDLTPLIQLIDGRKLFVAMSDELLSQPESAWISPTPELAEAGRELRNNNAQLSDECAISTGKVPTEKQANQALKILARIQSGEKGRAIRRWRAKIKEGKNHGLTPFQSLLPKYPLSGNRIPRVNKICKEFIDKFIKEHYSSPLRLMPARTYDLYVVLAKKEHPNYCPVSRTTLRKYIKIANQQKIARGRGGKRAANAAACPTDAAKRGFLATVPFELASIDHYLIDQECVITKSNGKSSTAKPWLTVMVDVNTKVVLAVWITFRYPSKRSCAMVIRMCVKNHGKLPKAIIVDGGSDFQSVYFLSLLSNFEIDLVQRPLSHARFGSEVERINLLYKTQWLALRPGNTAMYKESRAVSGSHTPSKTASLSIVDTWNELIQYIEWRNNLIVGNEIMSPIEKMASALEMYPFVGVEVEYNDEFKLQTAVDCGKYKVDPVRGINIDGTHYWCPELAKYSPLKKRIEVRYEPENPYQIYALLRDKWVACYASLHNTFKTKDPVVRLAEAVRILDCRAIRDAEKEEANQTLVKHAFDLNEQYQIRNKEAANKNDSDPASHLTNKPISIFEHLKKKPLNKIKAEKWGGTK